MTAYTDFHYSPTGSGVISGAQVLEQTEQGINGLGQYVQDNVSGAINTANEALTTAQSADSNATTAINLANSFNAQIIAANQTAGNALTTAQSAQNTANSASSLATTANNNAATALNTANAASAGVTTLTGTVNSLGNRMTAAENAINANAGNITTLQNNLATTNANVTAASNAASSAQATATSAQSTATLARNQAYVLRYTGTTITGGGTIAYADIDNTDNIKAGDKIIDISGAIYAIASVDIANQTVTVDASNIIHLACLTANNTFSGSNTFSQYQIFQAGAYFYNSDSTAATSGLNLRNSKVTKGGTSDNGSQIIQFLDKDDKFLSQITTTKALSGTTQLNFTLGNIDSNNNSISGSIQYSLAIDGTKQFIPGSTNTHNLGNSSYQWNNVYAKGYYYNGTAWGLDQANVWTGSNSFNNLIYSTTSLRVNNLSYESSTPSNNAFYNPLAMGGFVSNTWVTALAINGAVRTNGYNDCSIRVYSQINNTLTGVVAETNADSSVINFRPIANGNYNLGNSSYQWKTLNGLNPGVLSLPDTTRKSSILEYITDLTGGLQYYTPVADGWICIQADNASVSNYIRCAYDDILVKANGNGQAQGLSVLIPVLAGVQVAIRVVCTTLSSAYFYHCQGNIT